MTEIMIGKPGYPKTLLDPNVVADAIVNQILLGQSGQIFLPPHMNLLSGFRGLPAWLQERIRGSFRKVQQSGWSEMDYTR